MTADPDTATVPVDRPYELRVPDAEPSQLTAALAAFQAELPTVEKGNRADVKSERGQYSYRYADLSEISAVVLPLLGKHGMCWTTRPTMTHDGRFVLHYKLAHSSGETEEGEYPIGDPRSSPQALGSNLTYARRYSLCAVTGVAPGGDDDDAAEAADRRRQEAEAALREREETRTKARDYARTTRAQEEARKAKTTTGEPSSSAKAALDLLRHSCAEEGWDLEKVAASYAAEHDGASIKTATMREIETFRKSLFGRDTDELKVKAEPAKAAPDG